MAGETQIRSERVATAVTPDELGKIEEAARKLGEREHLNVTISDVVRSGALKRAEEILATFEAASA
jgi:hypothetical protein